MVEKEVMNVEVIESKPTKNIDSGGGRKKIIVIVIVAVVIVALLAYFFLLGDDNGNGDNGNGNRKPFADFTYTPEVIYVNDTVNFDASNSTDLDGDSLTYMWEFGDIYSDSGNPNTDSGKIGTHYYTVPGDYEVTLVVDDGEKQDTKVKNITVVPEETPSVSFFATKPNNTFTNIIWSLTVDAVDGTTEQLALNNIRYNFYNGSDTEDVKDTGLISSLGPRNPPPSSTPDGIYFNDNGDSILSVGDILSIAGDGDVGIQTGDYFQVIYEENKGEMMMAEALP